MSQSQQLHQCILEYQRIVSQLKEMAKSTDDKVLRSTLEESAHRVRMCMHECEYAARQVP